MNMGYLKETLRPFIELDRRSLALMRILVCIVVLTDLVLRALNFSAHYGVGSVMPPEALLHAGEGQSRLPFLPYVLYYLPLLPSLMFIAAFVVVVFVLIGYKTRLNTALAWFLILVIQSMNVFVLSGADDVVRIALFLGIFLPWGEYFSIDSALKNESAPPTRTASLWTFALLLQISFMYFFASLLKSKGIDWQDGSALYYALSTDITTPLGRMLLLAPSLLPFLTHAVRLFQLAIPFLIFFPVKTHLFRTIAMILLLLMHLSFALIFNIEIFSWISIALLCALIPSGFWEYVYDGLKARFGAITLYYDEDCLFCKRSSYFIKTFFVPHAEVVAAQRSPHIWEQMRRHDSWVVVDGYGNQTFTYTAAIELARHSPFLFFFVPFMRLPNMQKMGECTYRYIANHRPRMREHSPSRFTSSTRPATIASGTAAGIFIIAIAFWNVRTVFSFPVPDFYVQTMQTMGLAQSWGMFAPLPRDINYWYSVEGMTASGRNVQVFTIAYPYEDERWRKYLQHMTVYKSQYYRLHFLSYVCSTWNASHDQSERLTRVTLVYHFMPTLPDYQTTSATSAEVEKATCE